MFLLLHIYTLHKSSREREAKNEALLHVASQISCFSTKQKQKSLITDGIFTHSHTITHIYAHTHTPYNQTECKKARQNGLLQCHPVAVLRFFGAVSPKGSVADESSITKKGSKTSHINSQLKSNPSMVLYLGVLWRKGKGSHSGSTVNELKISSSRRSLNLVDRSKT